MTKTKEELALLYEEERERQRDVFERDLEPEAGNGTGIRSGDHGGGATALPNGGDEPPKPNAFKVSTLTGFLAKVIPPRESVLGFLSTSTLAMVVAWRGTGKTHVGLGVAVAIALGGKFLNWKAPKARRVLYVDGELPEEDLQQRLKLTLAVVTEQQTDPGPNLTILSASENRRSPNLAQEADREAIENLLEGVEVLVLDSLTTLCRGGEENKAESWQPIQDWLVSLRARGITVVILHHTGKDRVSQRGTSKRDDVLDFEILLKQPSDYVASEGARFEVTFEKTRHFRDPKEFAPFEAWLLTDKSGKSVWTMKPLAQARDERIRELADAGVKQSEIAKEVGVTASCVSKVLKAIRKVKP